MKTEFRCPKYSFMLPCPRWLWSGVIAFLFALSAASNSQQLFAQAGNAKEVNQDFRNKRPLQPLFTINGPDVETAVKAEDAGLRVTLDPNRPHHAPIAISSNFPIEGDFEITATFELLSATKPSKGWGAGVHLYVADTGKRDHFAKICRIMHPTAGSVFLAEYWQTKSVGKKDYKSPSQQTETKLGQLRLTRIGSTLRALVSDGPGEGFRSVFEKKEFGTDDLQVVNFGVTDSGEAGNAVDARLIQLQILMSVSLPDKAVAPAPLPTAAPVELPVIIETKETPRKSGWLIGMFAIGLGLILIPAIGIGIWRLMSDRSSVKPVTPPGSETKQTAFISLECPMCEKALSVKSESAGKNLKCPKCGAVINVPGNKN